MSVVTGNEHGCQYEVTRSVCLPVNTPWMGSLGPRLSTASHILLGFLLLNFPTLPLLALFLGQNPLTSVLKVGGAKYHE